MSACARIWRSKVSVSARNCASDMLCVSCRRRSMVCSRDACNCLRHENSRACRVASGVTTSALPGTRPAWSAPFCACSAARRDARISSAARSLRCCRVLERERGCAACTWAPVCSGSISRNLNGPISMMSFGRSGPYCTSIFWPFTLTPPKAPISSTSTPAGVRKSRACSRPTRQLSRRISLRAALPITASSGTCACRTVPSGSWISIFNIESASGYCSAAACGISHWVATQPRWSPTRTAVQ